MIKLKILFTTAFHTLTFVPSPYNKPNVLRNWLSCFNLHEAKLQFPKK